MRDQYEAGKKSAEVRKPVILFDGPKYSITKIPLNYRVEIKQSMELKHPHTGIDRDWYYAWPGTHDEKMAGAHEVAKDALEHFQPVSRKMPKGKLFASKQF